MFLNFCGNPELLSKCSKILNTSLFLILDSMLVIGAGIFKMLVRITNWEDPDQVQQCLSRAFWPATSVQNFRTSTVLKLYN